MRRASVSQHDPVNISAARSSLIWIGRRKAPEPMASRKTPDPDRRRRRRLVLAGVVGFNVTRDSRKKVAGPDPEGRARRDLTSMVSASGEVKPKRYVNIAANVSGRITQLYVKEGDTVQAGPGAGPHRLHALRGRRAPVAGRRAGGAGRPRPRARPISRPPRLAFERTKKMHDEKLVSDQAFDQAKAE